MRAYVREGMTSVDQLGVFINGLAICINVVGLWESAVGVEVHVVVAVVVEAEGRRGGRSGGHWGGW